MKKMIRWGRIALLFAVVALTASCSHKDDGMSDPDPEPKPKPSADAKLEKWMVAYMKSHYMWNEAMENVEPDYTLDYEAFLDKILCDIAAQNDINHDDGYWEGGKRQYFYSNIQRFPVSKSAMQTRGTHETVEGTGIGNLYYGTLNDAQTEYYFLLRDVSPYAPAGKAGLSRGDCILKIDGKAITDWKAGAERIRNPEGSVSVSGEKALGDVFADVAYASGSYEDNPIWVSKVLTAGNGAKVGYLYYDSFNRFYDDELLEAFESFRSQGVGELVLDLRYNSGGHVLSSAVLGTLVAGEARKDQVYARMIYNARRTAAGQTGDIYKIGNGNYGKSSYVKIAEALQASLGLECVYVLCSNRTASASELVINGLRGIGIEVRLIGTVTNGKNVGMEVNTTTLNGYEYEFSPITFYSENAKQFKDYGEGFTPDVAVDEGRIAIRDWGDPAEGMLAKALSWIATGVKPAGIRAVRAAAVDRFEIPAPRKPLEGMIVSGDSGKE